MAELKTKPTDASVLAFLDGVADEQRRADCHAVLDLLKEPTKAEPKMWGKSIVGFGDFHYKYTSGREGDWFVAGFSPRKQDLTIYLAPGLDGFADLLKKLGKHKRGKGCLYIRKLADIDLAVLKELVKQSLVTLKAIIKARTTSP